MKNTYLYILGLFILASCQTVVDLDVNEGVKSLISQSVLEFPQGDAFGNASVQLTETSAFFSNTSNPAVSGALVVINDLYILEEQGENTGLYTFDSIPLNQSASYKLSIEAELNGLEGSWEGEDVFTQLAQIDSFYIISDLDPDTFSKKGYFINMAFTEPGNEVNFYLQELEHKKADTINNNFRLPYAVIYDDFFANGQDLDFPINDVPFGIGDTACFKFSSISEPTYLYYENLNQLLFQTVGIGAAPPFPLRGNLVSKNDNFENALGNFKVKNVFQREVIIEQ